MLEISQPITETFARIFGLYMAAAGLGLFLGRERWDGVIEAFRSQPALLYIGAVLAFAQPMIDTMMAAGPSQRL